MMASVGSETSFESGRQHLHVLAGLEVTTKAVERHAEAIGADIAGREQAQLPMVRAGLDGRAGRTQGQPARTREVKLGCVFTQTTTDPRARPFAMPLPPLTSGRSNRPNRLAADFTLKPSSGVGIGPKRKSCWATVRSGSGTSPTSISPAQYTSSTSGTLASQLWDAAAKLFPSDEKQRKRWAKKLIRNLDQGRVENVVAELLNFPSRKTELRDFLRFEADYFQRNRDRMQYPNFGKQGLFFGPGVIEARCRTVIGSRLKQSGMLWTVRGANAIIALRCNRLSGKFENYWASRSAAA
jgi:hypothetical protein